MCARPSRAYRPRSPPGRLERPPAGGPLGFKTTIFSCGAPVIGFTWWSPFTGAKNNAIISYNTRYWLRGDSRSGRSFYWEFSRGKGGGERSANGGGGIAAGGRLFGEISEEERESEKKREEREKINRRVAAPGTVQMEGDIGRYYTNIYIYILLYAVRRRPLVIYQITCGARASLRGGNDSLTRRRDTNDARGNGSARAEFRADRISRGTNDCAAKFRTRTSGRKSAVRSFGKFTGFPPRGPTERALRETSPGKSFSYTALSATREFNIRINTPAFGKSRSTVTVAPRRDTRWWWWHG